MKKLFTFLFAAMGLTAMADNTVTVKYDFENYRLDTGGKYYEWFEKGADEAEVNLWASGNAGFAITAGKSPATDYPSVAIADGLDGACVKLETKSTGFLGAMVEMPIAAGNLFVGTFDATAAMSNAMAATKFGKPFDRKPLKFTGYYKYTAGAKVTDKSNKEVVGAVDQGRIYSVLYKNKDAAGNDVVLNGGDVLTNENIVAIADAGEISDAADWTKFEVSFDYKEISIDDELLKTGGYSLAVVFTSSVDGASFVGAVGSTMYVDKVEIVCEADADEPVAREFTDNLTVVLNGEPSEPQTSSIFVTDKGEGKYTLSLPNFILGTGADALPVGTITLEDVEGVEADGVVTLSATQTINIVAGDAEGVDGWLGPNLGEIPVTLNAEINGDKLTAEIDIPFGTLSIKVLFGKEYVADEPVAREFTDNLTVVLNGEPSEPQTSSIFVTDKGEGKYTLSLPNFILGTGADALPVGTITLEDVEGVEADGVVTLSATQTINIVAGDAEGVDGWLGPNLGEIPVTLNAEINGDKLTAEIDIPFGTLSIKVLFGKEYVGTGIDSIVTGTLESTAVYTIDGVKVSTMQPGNVYIMRKTDGKTVKIIK
ncbi:MAG: PCMD domain-containing protein [Clostridium sp.]|nr:PCMD domain-containing protein [Clostridium sp.]